VKSKLLIFVAVASAALAGIFLIRAHRARVADEAIWSDLAQHLPAPSLTTGEVSFPHDPVSIIPDHDGASDESGHVRLANGDLWRFAFRSHHLLDRPDLDGFAVFSGPLGTFRVRGEAFCCEVQIPKGTPSKDSTEFLAFLRRASNLVEPAP
jgi:hypothetical protein